MTNYKTSVIPIDPEHPQAAIITQAATLLQQGELVAFPTETVYGLGALTLKEEAVEKIFRAKGRPHSDPLISHIAELEELNQLTPAANDPLLQKVALTFWPGPLTIILPALPHVPRIVTAGLDTLAVRMPDHPVAKALIRAAGSPIAAPSANRFMHVSPTTAQHVYEDLQDRLPLILDGGPCSIGVESTIVDLQSNPPRLLRPGGVSLERLRQVLPQIQYTPQARGEEKESVAQLAPGQMPVHYAPDVPTWLFTGSPSQISVAIQDAARQAIQQGGRPGLLLPQNMLPTFTDPGMVRYSLGQSASEAAEQLFAGLRALEEREVTLILCADFSEEGLGLALRDRLRKASGGKIISV